MFICLQRSISDLHMVLLMPLPSRHLLWFLANVNSRSRSLYAIARPSVSVCRLSVCL